MFDKNLRLEFHIHVWKDASRNWHAQCDEAGFSATNAKREELNREIRQHFAKVQLDFDASMVSLEFRGFPVPENTA